MEAFVFGFCECIYGLFFVGEGFLALSREVVEVPFAFGSEDELFRFASRFIQLVNGFLRECRSATPSAVSSITLMRMVLLSAF